MRAQRTWAVVLAVALVGGPGFADPVTDTADAVIEAVRKHDTLRLRYFAQAEDPDPWLVAEELLQRGEAAAAAALAEAGATADVKQLAAYVAQRRAVPGPVADRVHLAEAGRALEEGRIHEALESLRAISTIRDDVPSAMALYVRGIAEHGLPESSGSSFADCAAVAERIGWLGMATRARGAAAAYALERGQLDVAEDHAQRLVGLGERRKSVEAIAQGSEQLASVALRRGDARAALTFLEAALQAYGTDLDAGGRAHCLIRTADIHVRAGRVETAEQTYREALGLAGRAKRPDLEARARRGLGVGLARIGAYANAEKELERALEIATGADLDAVRADVLANLAVVLLHRGQYSRALALGHEGIAVHRRGAPGEGLAAALMNVGLTHASLGKNDVALRYLEQARGMYAALSDRSAVGRVLSNMGVVQGALGNLDEALACQQEALDLERELGNAVGQALVLGRLGHVHGQRGAYDEAIVRHERAILLKRTLKDRLGEALSLEAVGSMQQQLGNFAEAEARRREALYLAERLGAQDVVARVHWGLAELALLSADPERALVSAKTAVEALPAFARGLFDEQGAHARERWAGVHDIGMAAAASLDDAASFVWFLERQRGATLMASLGGREALADATIPEPLCRALATAREVEARTLRTFRDAVESGSRRRIRRARATLSDARHAMREVRERIAGEAAAAAQIFDAKPANVQRLKSLVRPGDALVLYALLPDQAYAILVTTRGLSLRPLGPARTLIEACAGLEVEGRGHLSDDLVSHFRTLLIEPLELDKRTKRVIVSPDGVLCGVPFTLLLPSQDVVYVPSGTTYAYLRGADRRAVKGRGVLALGRPIYGPMEVAAPPGPDGVQRGKVRKAHPAGILPALDGSAVEVRAIGDLVLTDGEATEDALQAALLARARWRAVHLACHGLVDFDRPLFSALALTPNAVGDGLLTTLDVFGMRVPADLVVLSACETGRGRLLRTEGVFGFTRAFMFAGAPRVIVSLWKVDDEATRALMQKFYALWNPPLGGKRGLPAAEALRLAQAHVRADPRWADPYFWAAWQLWGLAD